MKTVLDILKSKPFQSAHTITPAASAFDALKLMADKDGPRGAEGATPRLRAQARH
jgi:hypothetical protein